MIILLGYHYLYKYFYQTINSNSVTTIYWILYLLYPFLQIQLYKFLFIQTAESELMNSS